jgi:hypothetical protein
LIGVDEQTAFVRNAASGELWEVRGRGAVTVIRDRSQPVRYEPVERVLL